MEFYATLGGACTKPATLDQLFQAGMTGARLNLSHTTLSRCTALLNDAFWPAARRAGRPQAHLILDMQGPELRVGELPNPIPLKPGDSILLGDGGIPVPKAVLEYAKPGQEISIDDSALLLQVRKASSSNLLCKVLRGGALRSRKSLSLPGAQMVAPTLTQSDLDNLALAGEFGVTHILQPFVRGRRDLEILRETLQRLGLPQLKIMAKIESLQGVEHLEDIMSLADEICIARGDLGNSMPLWKLPGVQKDITRRCRAQEKPFCLVTQLLWSMEQRPVPTRAEVCDIYNGVLDGATSLMLTGETAAGRWPGQAMEYLVKTAREAEQAMKQEVAL